MSAATTLSELKRDLAENHIGYDGLTFYEGISKTELKDDNSQLPKDVLYKGQPTNELVFMLSVPNKKITSGLTERQIVILAIKNQNLTEKCKQIFGRNYVNCSTADLKKLLESTNKSSVVKKSTTTSSKQSGEVNKFAELEARVAKLEEALLTPCTECSKAIEEKMPETKALTSSYDEDELDEIFEGI
jgi:hypothetical protein